MSNIEYFRPEDDEIPSLLLKFPVQPLSPESKSPTEGQTQTPRREKKGSHGARRLIDRRVRFFASSKQPAAAEPLSAATAENGKKACSASEDESGAGVEVGETRLTIICRLLQVGSDEALIRLEVNGRDWGWFQIFSKQTVIMESFLEALKTDMVGNKADAGRGKRACQVT